MKYLLDTCVISDYVKGEPGTLKHIQRVKPSEIVISSITVMEIEFGLELDKIRAAKFTSSRPPDGPCLLFGGNGEVAFFA